MDVLPVTRLIVSLGSHSRGAEVPPAPAGRPPAIEIEESIDFQRRSWRVQRAAWLAIGLMLGGAVIGLFGLGPLSRARLTIGPGVSLEYHRLARAHAPLELRFQVAEAGTGLTRLHLSHSLLSQVRVVRIDPEPLKSSADSTGIGYEFRITGSAPVVFHVEPERPGRVTGHIRTGDTAPIEIPLLVLP
jgi:hypothetical protein